MRIGIGLPNGIPGCPGALLPEWSRVAEEYGFSSLATVDRVAFANHDPLISLAAAAAVTERIRLLTNILLLPTRQAVVVAKEAATLAALSQGRLTLGVSVGGRPDDFAVSGTEFAGRGRRVDHMLETMITAWREEPVAGSLEPVVPLVPGRSVPLLIGGRSDASLRRVARFGVGWASGGLPPGRIPPLAAKLRNAWQAAGRSGDPQIVGLVYFSLGDDVLEASRNYLRHYYGFLPDAGAASAGNALRSSGTINAAVAQFSDAGADEVVFVPSVADIDQVRRLADVSN